MSKEHALRPKFACPYWFALPFPSRLVAGAVFVALHGKMKSKRQVVFAQFMQLQRWALHTPPPTPPHAQTKHLTAMHAHYHRGALLCTDVMARGVDFPSVHWVVQYDPPSAARWVM